MSNLPAAIGKNDWTKAIQPGPIWDINYIPSVFITGKKSDMDSLVKDLSKNIYKAKITMIDADTAHTFEVSAIGSRTGEMYTDWPYTLFSLVRWLPTPQAWQEAQQC